MVVFGGVGEVAPGLGELSADHLLPAGGGGLRFLISRKYKLNFRIDVAQGKDGHTFGMGIGEAF